ncbi:unnamed protein product [Staurois parvus]|uniref:Uncharacterized protein n=1 Tax=Staurois parvus TaxID=386267 RepID=A0ABN9EX09_9NEOB|nr:unnamed protein product [Staurois parvus]
MPESGFCVPVPASVGTYGGAETAANLKFFRNCNFLRNDVSNHFTYILSRVLCPVPCLHFDCSFCLELRKVHGVQKASLLVKRGFRPAREQR